MDRDYWYARDKNGDLYAYKEEPHKLSESWSNDEFDCEWDKVVPDIGYDYIRWDDKRATHGAFMQMQSPNKNFKLTYLEKKDLFIASFPVSVSKESISILKEQLESTLGSKVVAIYGEFEYIKELHNLSS